LAASLTTGEVTGQDDEADLDGSTRDRGDDADH
jgi:hypothetical protein